MSDVIIRARDCANSVVYGGLTKEQRREAIAVLTEAISHVTLEERMTFQDVLNVLHP